MVDEVREKQQTHTLRVSCVCVCVCAQNLLLFVFLLLLQHGATYTCDVEFGCNALDPETNWVLDIGLALTMLGEVLAKYNLQNLDDLFPSQLTTTEFMAQQIHQDLCERLRKECPTFEGDLCVKLWESHKAWASYTHPVQ